MRYKKGTVAKLCATAIISSTLSACFMAPGQHYVMRSINNPPRAVAASVRLERLDYNLLHKSPKLFAIDAYRIGPEDVLNITVWDHPELTIPQGSFRTAEESGIEVQTNGKIFYPFAGYFNVNNMTVNQIRTLLTKRLVKYIRDPQVSVRVAAYNSKKVQVLGSVISPKTLSLQSSPTSAMQAINAAGGLNPYAANAAFIYIIRPGKHTPTVYTFNSDDPTAVIVASRMYLKNGDIIYVSTSGVVNWSRFINNLLPTFGPAVTAAKMVG